MSNSYPGLYASPFHVRMAERNIYNAWIGRGIFTLPRHFGNAAHEAISLRFSAALADLSSFGRLQQRRIPDQLRLGVRRLASRMDASLRWS